MTLQISTPGRATEIERLQKSPKILSQKYVLLEAQLVGEKMGHEPIYNKFLKEYKNKYIRLTVGKL